MQQGWHRGGEEQTHLLPTLTSSVLLVPLTHAGGRLPEPAGHQPAAAVTSPSPAASDTICPPTRPVFMQGGYLSPRVINLLLQYITQALAFSHTWKALKPHVEQMLLQ